MLIITGYVQVDPTDVAQFLADLRELAIASRKRPGNFAYDAGIEDPITGRLLISERWADQQALSAHLAAADTVAFVARWQGRMQGNVRKFDASNERGLMDR
ncbi:MULTISPECIES: putative quinol monooxygenase [Rhizobium]|uniref:Quinol monooxygenase YgiN n=1 Tax=Rhizobium esperanzae TaxID=1967781 RepID=A0A7W6Y194_9HYPH|nr:MULTISPECIES: putative quinol monooxygenase [Rhizobium]MBB4443469.1 quinol monooxygenase YgiN [Rhizobium esperanzae]MBY5345273.1 antibiotic biosynthesis monooxygenase [Rhizobium leguminosarum]MBY5376123.1 antibiotic biosynthesis monooxygenase [Rhizobium leguminosarum]MBY5392383.1 antibiotic biosynthesis monooxygenase [Rhizobium leguminosarum]MBY5399357.1 antibiotic biosynthesis monooxygenase [Rhizobium leguminosarum]